MKKYTKFQKLIGAFVIGLGTLAACCMTSTFISSLSGSLSSSSPRSEQITNPLALTAEMIGLTQTAVSLPTLTLTNLPTASPTLASTATLAPTLTLAPTSTVVLITVPPAGGSGGSGGSSGGGSGGGGGSPGVTPVGGPCPCNGDTMNCSDFRNQKAAQACYDHCKSQGFGDIHRLDRDNDGIACEG